MAAFSSRHFAATVQRTRMVASSAPGSAAPPQQKLWPVFHSEPRKGEILTAVRQSLNLTHEQSKELAELLKSLPISSDVPMNRGPALQAVRAAKQRRAALIERCQQRADGAWGDTVAAFGGRHVPVMSTEELTSLEALLGRSDEELQSWVDRPGAMPRNLPEEDVAARLINFARFRQGTWEFK
mmetsp:Transcript_84238/g.192098  ORF Transcript_84238/g.192098 Transcript_84238/m.192098 type:complete len:183 (+) Transcript_84238:29-577(+)